MNKKPVSYLQYDKRWGSLPYQVKGEVTDIAESGCGPTCAAMLITTLTGKTITPDITCKWSVDHGYKALGQGTYYSYFQPQFAVYNINAYQFSWINNYHNPSASTINKILEMLEDGFYIIACMGPGRWTASGHFIVLWGCSGGTIYINDPASTSSNRTTANADDVFYQAKYFFVVDARAYNKPVETPKKETEENEMVYNTIAEVPEWGKEAVQSAIDKKILNGNGNGLGINETFLKCLVVMHRANVF